MKKIQLKERVMNYLGIALGSIFYAAGVVLFLQPNNMVAGGVGGLSVVIDHYTGIPSGTWVLLLNVPLLILAWWKLGFEYFLNTLLAVGISSVFMNAMLPLNDLLEKGALTTDPFLAAATGGALIALGLGVVFRARGTTGGSDIVARLLKMKYPHMKTGVLILIMDAIVITLSVIAFGEFELGLYSGAGVLIQAWLFDTVLYGSDSAKLVYVVSSNPEELTRRFLGELNVGVTSIRAIGSYTGEERVMLLCAMHKKILPQARVVVREVDPGAFLIVTPATQIFGEGFIHHDREEI
ncbi:MAG: YitT family protein [Clostridia bacterium]|nr:YitT family protein [Clostridia bacterium]